ncbi:alkyl sulfatase dimerization domain-containing protein [Acinetobacter sp. ANC 3832]|uniref:alkyl sulfatase dimerization domain-containing protein n=1 Tax=Acinetobacter sp. ANC 3832 TaxID=1977874 RepID=UPI00148AB28F|nr:alkyl sulfatase dimerization domain-containing protein [Acinetobacter sp. ANC 3832]
MRKQKTEILISQHHWPVWGNKNISEFITLHRDVYKFLHDQTLKMMNQGYTADEIAEKIQLPENLNKHLSIGGYYGSIKHNVKGIYQYYIGWFDGNPANLDMLPRKQRSLKYIHTMGGEDAVLQTAIDAKKQGEERWAAELLNHILTVNPKKTAAQEALAEVYLTLGYDAESIAWRNFYISAAKDLRQEKSSSDRKRIDMSAILQQAPVSVFLDKLSTLLKVNTPDSLTQISIDKHDFYEISIHNSVMNYKKIHQLDPKKTTLNLSKNNFIAIINHTTLLDDQQQFFLIALI